MAACISSRPVLVAPGGIFLFPNIRFAPPQPWPLRHRGQKARAMRVILRLVPQRLADDIPRLNLIPYPRRTKAQRDAVGLRCCGAGSGTDGAEAASRGGLRTVGGGGWAGTLRMFKRDHRNTSINGSQGKGSNALYFVHNRCLVHKKMIDVIWDRI